MVEKLERTNAPRVLSVLHKESDRRSEMDGFGFGMVSERNVNI